jgi:hypothetical protein
LRALPPIAAGHLLSLALVVTVVSLTALAVHIDRLRQGTAVVLIGFGVFKLLRPKSHPRWVGFRISGTALALWSLLMSTAHGAGLMLLPVLLGPAQHRDTDISTMTHPMSMNMDMGPAAPTLLALKPANIAAALLIHTTAMLLTMGIIAVVVYAKVGLEILRRAWINLDIVWALVLVLSGLFLLV